MPSQELARHSEIRTYSFIGENFWRRGERCRKELDIITQTTITSFSFFSFFLTIGYDIVQRMSSTEPQHSLYRESLHNKTKPLQSRTVTLPFLYSVTGLSFTDTFITDKLNV